jgi:hypothetical protein
LNCIDSIDSFEAPPDAFDIVVIAPLSARDVLAGKELGPSNVIAPFGSLSFYIK